jgi:hypothetical protein
MGCKRETRHLMRVMHVRDLCDPDFEGRENEKCSYSHVPPRFGRQAGYQTRGESRLNPKKPGLFAAQPPIPAFLSCRSLLSRGVVGEKVVVLGSLSLVVGFQASCF